VRFAVANQDGTVLDFDDSRIGDGDFEDVGSKVFQACFARTHRLGVDVPVDLPDLGGDLVKETSFLDLISELGFKDNGESLDGEIVIDPGGMPEAIGGREGSAGDDVVDMGVIL